MSVLVCWRNSAMNSAIFPSMISYSGSVSTVGSSGKNRGFLNSLRYLKNTHNFKKDNQFAKHTNLNVTLNQNLYLFVDEL